MLLHLALKLYCIKHAATPGEKKTTDQCGYLPEGVEKKTIDQCGYLGVEKKTTDQCGYLPEGVEKKTTDQCGYLTYLEV